MFERYTERARRVLFFARYEATQAGSDAIHPEHLLLGLLRDGGSGHMFGPVTLESIRAGLAPTLTATAGRPELQEIPFTPATKKILLFAGEEADSLESRDITPWHLLLGILREGESQAARLLEQLGMELDAVHTAAGHVSAPSDAGSVGPSPDFHREAIPPSPEVRVSISTRRGTSSSRGPRHWFFEGFSFVQALSAIYDFPASRIECRDIVTHDRAYDLFLVPPTLAVAPPLDLDHLMRAAVERHFDIAVSRETRPSPVLVLGAAKGPIRAPQISPIDVGGAVAWSTEWSEQSDEPHPPGDAQQRQLLETRLRMFVEGRGAAATPPPGSTFGPAHLSGSVTMARLCEMLESSVGRAVVDETEMPGTFEVKFQADSPGIDDITVALRDQVGLTLTPGEREVTFLVVRPA